MAYFQGLSVSFREGMSVLFTTCFPNRILRSAGDNRQWRSYHPESGMSRQHRTEEGTAPRFAKGNHQARNSEKNHGESAIWANFLTTFSAGSGWSSQNARNIQDLGIIGQFAQNNEEQNVHRKLIFLELATKWFPVPGQVCRGSSNLSHLSKINQFHYVGKDSSFMGTPSWDMNDLLFSQCFCYLEMLAHSWCPWQNWHSQSNLEPAAILLK